MPSQVDNKYYDDLARVFSCDGWRALVEEARGEYEGILNILAVEKDHGQIREYQGKLLVLDRMIHLEALAKQSYEAMIEEEKQLAEEEASNDNL